jgi:flagellum-specific peptidoglycan hydrolase FlgJ
MTPEQLRNLKAIAAAAVACERATRVPAELIAAQCILESAWLMRMSGANNPFGIKRAKRHASGQMCETVEYVHGKPVRVQAEFACYPSLEAAFSDHALLIATGRPYARAWQEYQADGNVDRLIDGVASRYATDPSYAAKLRRIVASHDVRAALADARAA